MPFEVSDFSNSERNLWASSGCSGGTRMGGPAPGAGLAAPDSGGGGVLSMTMPSNRGKGPAIAQRVIISIRSHQPYLCTSKHDTCLRSTHAAKPIHRMACAQPVHVRSIEEQSQIQRGSGDPGSLYLQAARSKHVGTISRHTFGIFLDPKYTYLSKSSRGQVCLFKERNSNLASDDA